MATRLSVITTRTGDQGTTGLGDGTRVRKDSARINALGDVDELNSTLGLLRTETLPDDIDTLLDRIQHDLFDMGAELCIPGHQAIRETQVLALDEAVAHYNAELGKLEEFILPGGCRAAALAHVARTVCRRAERSVVAMAAGTDGATTKNTEHGGTAISDPPQDTVTEHHDADGVGVNPPVRQYLNRLSDLLFVLARALNRHAGRSDVLWQR